MPFLHLLRWSMVSGLPFVDVVYLLP
jgi:hypothetical protein